MDIFKIVYGTLEPYMYGILKITLATTLYSNAIKIIRSKTGSSGVGTGVGGNPYSGITVAFMGYLAGRTIPISIGLIDAICNDIINNMKVIR